MDFYYYFDIHDNIYTCSIVLGDFVVDDYVFGLSVCLFLSVSVHDNSQSSTLVSW